MQTKTQLIVLQVQEKESFYQLLGEGIRKRIDYLQDELELNPDNPDNSVEVDNLFQTIELLGLQSWIIPF